MVPLERHHSSGSTNSNSSSNSFGVSKRRSRLNSGSSTDSFFDSLNMTATGNSSSPSSLRPLTSQSQPLLPLYNELLQQQQHDDSESSSVRSSTSRSSQQSSRSKPWMVKSGGSLNGSDRESAMPLHRNDSQRQLTAVHEELRASQSTLEYYHEEDLQGGDSGNNNHHNDNNTQYVFTAKKRKNPFCIGLILFCVAGMVLYSQSHKTIHVALEQVSRLTLERRTVHQQMHQLEKGLKEFEKELVELSGTRFSSQQEGQRLRNGGGTNANEDAVGEMMALQEKLKLGNTHVSNLHKHLQDASKRDALRKYGGGVIRVQLELEFPGDEGEGGEAAATSKNNDNNHIVMEMASLDLMPHSVFMFLEMANAELLDGCSFILNAMHVIKAAPLPYDGSSASAKVRSFAKKGLESVSFREYSPDFPHTKYSVGFAADGSPSFFFNTQDNTDVHQGDPCFAKIVSGFETVDRLEAAPTRNGIWYKHRIGLKKATIL